MHVKSQKLDPIGPATKHASTQSPDAEAALTLKRVESIVGRLVEGVAALLIVAEIAILLSGVVARYFLKTPLVWSDEVASLLFLWLAVLGAVVAFRRGEHMRMTALVHRLSPSAQAFAGCLALTAALAFLVLHLPPAIAHAREEASVLTPALEISSAWRASALPVGLALMALVATLRLLRTSPGWRPLLAALLAVVLACGGMTAIGPLLTDLGNINLIIFFVGVTAVCVLAGVPIAVSFGLATFGFLSLTTSMPLGVIVGRMDEGMSHVVLLSVPLFVFLGLLIEMTGMARAMVAFLASLLGHVRGGLSYVLLGAMYLVSGISGSKVADMAAVAPVLFPEMMKRGARDGDLVAMLAASGAQTETIPPSLVLITIGSVTGVSIAALFAGGMVPGLVMGVCLCALIGFKSRREDLSHVHRARIGQIGRAFVAALPAVALPFVIRAAVVEGVATATEVSTLGILYAVIAGLLFYRRFEWRRLLPMLVDTAALSGAILLIIGTATGMAWSLTQSGFSGQLAALMAGLPGGAGTFLLVSVLAFIVLGSVLEGIPAIVLFGPLLFPIARQVGVNEVHYAMVVVLAMGVGLFTPPFGVGYYAACAIGRVDPRNGMKPMVGYVLALLVGLALVTAVPWFSTAFIPAR
ncbi:TRAP transporter large permease [Cupriavidus pinatubonensis]|uniref:Sialic acid TRAP transporter permease protein SiaT n=1 Tax=Cupriavidus pinatubonensis TaxID=248026 RepID=A0ABN7Z8U9_9BURK|nr:TRAP transporter large permease subunit [Cupriavidus pinatubonensis]CAG9181116.1 Sialic acid TRAP transporter permease protein SiaT [Cupriavidus pinatubonensis]